MRIRYIGGPTASLEIGGLRLLTDPTFDGPGGEPLVGEVTGFVLTGAGLPTVYISGDNASLAVVRAIAERFGPVDVAVLFAGGAKTAPLGDAFFTLSSPLAAEAAHILGAAHVVPVHFEGTVWVGTSGWSYAHWNRTFYPDKQPAREHLAFYAGQFGTVEINYSYYRLPERSTFADWQRTAPAGFLFAVKASRYLTHMKKLKDPAEPLQRLLDHAGGLGEACGPVLFQFPRRWALDLGRLTEFLEALRAFPQHRYAFEFRHQSWLTDAVYAQLRTSNTALCLPIGWGLPLDVQLTADWTYLRFHGGRAGIGFEDDELGPWAERITRWRDQGFDSYSYFNNDSLWNGRPAAIDNARRLREMVGV